MTGTPPAETGCQLDDSGKAAEAVEGKADRAPTRSAITPLYRPPVGCRFRMGVALRFG